ncbi:AbfB domain-containing protein [Streptomyces sp. SAS_272]|uniref:AbfB domain-containing protein n=1 Tax=Streptomyces sp. SAS_272 TaxID=3412747 RepID=UPI00403CAA20
MRHRDFRIRFDAGDGTGIFDKDATFCARTGSTAGSVSLESYDHPGRHVRHYDYALRVDTFQDTAAFRADSSFTAVSPRACPVRPTLLRRRGPNPRRRGLRAARTGRGPRRQVGPTSPSCRTPHAPAGHIPCPAGRQVTCGHGPFAEDQGFCVARLDTSDVRVR